MSRAENMVKAKKQDSMAKTAAAIQAISRLLDSGREVTVKQLVEETGLSRSFFYHNEEVKQTLDEAIKSQADSESYQLRLRVAQLERQLQQSVARADFIKLKQEYDELLNTKVIEVYDDLT